MIFKNPIEDGDESCNCRSVTSSSASDGNVNMTEKNDCDHDCSSSVKVVVRVRPLCPNEVGCNQCVDSLSSTRCENTEMLDTIRIGGEHGPSFVFDFVYSPNSTQREVFTSSIMPLLDSCLEGYNATILAYGQTGSGKTYTVFGPSTAKSFDDESVYGNSSGILSEAGMIPRALQTVFNRLEKLKSDANVSGSESTNFDYEVRLQFLELYGEDIHDLLSCSSSTKLSIRDGGAMVEPEVIGATELKVSSADDAMLYLARGALRRITGATAMNSESSRSHAIMTLIIEQSYSYQATIIGDEYDNSGMDTETKRSKLHFVDLAGSERQKRSLAAGLRLKEGININKGLLVLGNVISALGDPKKKGKVFVPYRDSKLTRLLKGSLGGNHKTLMVACVSPSSSNMEETLNCLRYANRAKNIQNKAILSTGTESRLLFALKNLLKELATELLNLRKPNESSSRFTYNHLVDLSQGKVLLEGISQDRSNASQPLQVQLKRRGSESITTITTVLSDVSSESGNKQTGNDDKRKLGGNLSRPIDKSLVEERDASSGYDKCKEKYPMSKSIVIEINDEHDQLEAIAQKYIHLNPDIQVALSEESTPNVGLPTASETFVNEKSINNVDDGYFRMQRKYQKDMSYLSESIATKEELIKELETSQQKYESMRSQYESKLNELEAQLKIFEAERDYMINSLQSNRHTFDASQTIKKNLSEKENQISVLKKRQIELAALTHSSAQSRHVIDTLKGEVESLKRQKADLQRKLTTEQMVHTQEVTKLRREAACHERNAERSKNDLFRVLKEKERLDRVAKIRSDEINRLRMKYRDSDKKKRMFTLKRGVMEKAGIDPVLLGQNQPKRQCRNIDNYSSCSSDIKNDRIEEIRDFVNIKVAEISKKEACADKLAHAWEDHMELVMTRDELNQSSNEERDDIQDQLDALDIQIVYKEELIRALAKGLGDRPKCMPSGDDLFKYIFSDQQFTSLCEPLTPIESSQLLSKVLFGMLVRERRRVAALARTASSIDQKLFETSKWAESQEASLRAQLDDEKTQNLMLTKRQQDQISSLMELAQLERSVDDSKGSAISSTGHSESLIIRLANERIITLEALISGYQSESENNARLQQAEVKMQQEKRSVEYECETLRQEVLALKSALLQIRSVTTSSLDKDNGCTEAEPTLFRDRAICKIINDVLHPAGTTQNEASKLHFMDCSTSVLDILNSKNEFCDDESPEWMDDIMKDLAIIAAGEQPPSLKRIMIPDAVMSPNKQKGQRQDNNAARRMTRFSTEPETEYSSVFDRLQSPSNYTGVQKQVHDELRRRQQEKLVSQSEVKRRPVDLMRPRAHSELKRRIPESSDSDVFKRLQETETKSYSYARKACE